jgi:hypothetical protein
MSIYDINYALAWSNLLPTTKRKTKMLAWGTALLKPLQWLRDLIFGDYADGANYALWAYFVYYTKGDRVVGLNKRVYEALIDTPPFPSAVFPDTNDTTYWIEVSPNFIGLRERIKYNSEIIVLEYALNKWYRVPTSDPQIYISNNNTGSGFLMGASSATSSVMANDSYFSTTYMGLTYTAVTYDFTVFVPTVLFATLGSNLANRENNIRSFVDKYKLAGLNYNCVTF